MANFMNLFFLNHRKNVALFRKAGSARFSVLVTKNRVAKACSSE